ncbi:NnrS family protein [Roseateles sp. DXS20W]|uniref:NnrS family protein n=1 Tax=Pelomonas lactea TaxID=3299030 RepID=A0ABW7GKK7_9BURK
MALIPLEEPPRAPRPAFALFALGFRPFYLLASVFAALSVPLWALQFSGLLGHAYLAGPLWHAHEMLFGFTLAVIVGFLFTAGRNWTNLPTPTGGPLAALVLLWLAARVLVLTRWGVAAALANIAFPLAAAGALAVPFVRARNRRNYFFIGLLLLLAAVAAVFHLGQLGFIAVAPLPGLQVALDVVLFILTVMGGRVIPMFTNNGVPGAAATRRPVVEKAALGLVLALGVADLLGLGGWPVAAIAAAAGAAHAVRWALWQPWKTLRVPLVWVLHLAYAWIPVHLLLRAGGALDWVTPSLATHALTVGAVGGLVIGMMTRTARGHTGRALRADGFETACYVAVLLAALVRVVLPLLQPAWTLPAVQASAALWSAGFGLYAWRYWPVLSRPRVDGRPG